MILTLDRKGHQIGGGGTSVRVDPDGSVLRPWCLAALTDGWDLDGMVLEMWDCGADERAAPMLCVTVQNAVTVLQPSVDRARAAEKRGKRRTRSEIEETN